MINFIEIKLKKFRNHKSRSTPRFARAARHPHQILNSCRYQFINFLDKNNNNKMVTFYYLYFVKLMLVVVIYQSDLSHFKLLEYCKMIGYIAKEKVIEK